MQTDRSLLSASPATAGLAGGDDRTPRGTRPRRRARTRWLFTDRVAPFVLVAPTVLVIVGLRLYPLVLGINFSFTGDRERRGEWVGLEHYVTLFADPLFRQSLRNVGLLVLLLPVAVAIPGIIATFIYLRVPGHRVYRSVYFFPAVLSPVIVGGIFNLLLAVNGPLNELLSSVSIGPIDWLGDRRIAMLVVVAVYVWATLGMSLVVFLAGFATLDESLLDAALTDGASLRQTIWHVIIPSLTRTIQFVFVTTMIGLLTAMFGLLLIMTHGGPGGATYLPEYYIWIQLGQMNRPALASSASTVLFLIMLVVGLAQLSVLRRSGRVD